MKNDSHQSIPNQDSHWNGVVLMKLDQQIKRAKDRLAYLESLKAAALGIPLAEKPTEFVWMRTPDGALVAFAEGIPTPETFEKKTGASL